eukprot:gene33972-43886_t
MEVMVDPVIVSSTGQTYERTAIETWLSEHNTCPLTGLVLPEGSRDLTPNISLRNAINEWCLAANRVIDDLNHGISFERIKIDSLLLSARTKDIFKGTLFGQPVAVCVIKGPAVMLSEGECKILTTIGLHPNIVRFLARSIDNKGQCVIVLELAPDAEGMDELTANNIFHNNLAARNILVFSYDALAPERILVKVSDFGMSSIMETSSSHCYSSESAATLPIRWMTPESLSKNI